MWVSRWAFLTYVGFFLGSIAFMDLYHHTKSLKGSPWLSGIREWIVIGMLFTALGLYFFFAHVFCISLLRIFKLNVVRHKRFGSSDSIRLPFDVRQPIHLWEWVYSAIDVWTFGIVFSLVYAPVTDLIYYVFGQGLMGNLAWNTVTGLVVLFLHRKARKVNP